MRNKEPKKNAEEYWQIRKPNLRTFLVIIGSLFWTFMVIGTLIVVMTNTSPFSGGLHVIGSTLMVIFLILSLGIVPVILHIAINGDRR